MKGRAGYWVSFNQDADSLVRMKEHASRSTTKVHEQALFRDTSREFVDRTP
jgi:hypothetical protein